MQPIKYFGFQSVAVENAVVSITEGLRNLDGSIIWDTANKVVLAETNNGNLPVQFRRGVYFDPRIFSNPLLALKGKVGKAYLLQILAGGKQYSAVTTLLTPIPVDSITSGFRIVNDSNQTKVRITNNYKDPDSIGNRQFYYWRDSSNRNNFGWGGLTKSGWPGDDNFTNGEYIRLIHSQEFNVRDTVQYFMASVTREVYNFWDSYNKAENNNGPFSTPVSLITNIRGDNVTGCFSGLALSNTTIITK
ncbi:MAG: DUF4249 family protein [Flavobacterium sp.]|nr:DUF4249 family protein [Flavobacterium sp.]